MGKPTLPTYQPSYKTIKTHLKQQHTNSLKHFSFHLLMHKGTYYHQSQQTTKHHTILTYTIRHKNLNVETHVGQNHKSDLHLVVVVS